MKAKDERSLPGTFLRRPVLLKKRGSGVVLQSRTKEEVEVFGLGVVAWLPWGQNTQPSSRLLENQDFTGAGRMNLGRC